MYKKFQNTLLFNTFCVFYSLKINDACILDLQASLVFKQISFIFVLVDFYLNVV